MTPIEIRGIWLTDTDSQVLYSQQRITEAIEFIAQTGFNVVFPVVWKGLTLYPSQVMQQFGMEIDPRFSGRDPLAEIIIAARRVGLKVIPWFEYGFASSYNAKGGMLIQHKPEWAACDYNGKLLNKNGFDWLNALDPEVQNFLLSLILEVVNNYDVDGIQGDDRIPAFPCEGGYDSKTLTRYRQEFGQHPPQNPKHHQWLQWRADILTEYLARIYQQVKAVNPQLIISISPNVYDWAYKEYLQDSPTWLKRGIVDILHPQIYRRDFPSYKNLLNKLVQEQFTQATLPRIAPGILMKIGSYYISSAELLQTIKFNRTCGVAGEVFFFYEGLRHNNNALAKALRQSIYAQPAQFPTLADLTTNMCKPTHLSVWEQLVTLLKNII